MKKYLRQPGPFALLPLQSFIATTDQSVPTRHIGTLPLAISVALRFFLGIDVLVPTFHVSA